MWQSGVLTGEPCTFWSKIGHFRRFGTTKIRSPHGPSSATNLVAQIARCNRDVRSHIPKSLAMRKSFFASDAKTHSLDLKSQENARKKACENPAMLACDAKNRGVFQDRAMRNACDSDSRCGLACDASTRGAKSLAMWVEQCEPLRPRKV